MCNLLLSVLFKSTNITVDLAVYTLHNTGNYHELLPWAAHRLQHNREHLNNLGSAQYPNQFLWVDYKPVYFGGVILITWGRHREVMLFIWRLSS